RAWLEKGLDPPADVIDTTKEYRKSEDVVQDYIEDNIERTNDADDFIANAQLFENFDLWQKGSGEKRLEKKAFERRFNAGEPHRTKTARGRRYLRFKVGAWGQREAEKAPDFGRR